MDERMEPSTNFYTNTRIYRAQQSLFEYSWLLFVDGWASIYYQNGNTKKNLDLRTKYTKDI